MLELLATSYFFSFVELIFESILPLLFNCLKMTIILTDHMRGRLLDHKHFLELAFHSWNLYFIHRVSGLSHFERIRRDFNRGHPILPLLFSSYMTISYLRGGRRVN